MIILLHNTWICNPFEEINSFTLVTTLISSQLWKAEPLRIKFQPHFFFSSIQLFPLVSGINTGGPLSQRRELQTSAEGKSRCRFPRDCHQIRWQVVLSRMERTGAAQWATTQDCQQSDDLGRLVPERRYRYRDHIQARTEK